MLAWQSLIDLPLVVSLACVDSASCQAGGYAQAHKCVVIVVLAVMDCCCALSGWQPPVGPYSKAAVSCAGVAGPRGGVYVRSCW